jgi:predicted peroxiredoxin
MKVVIFFVLVSTAALMLVPEEDISAERSPDQVIVVQLKHFTDDLHAAAMALKLAEGMSSRGADVTMFLNLEAVRLADKRQPQDLKWGTGPSMSELYGRFVESGGKVLVCPHCAHAAGLTADSLRDGARIGEEGETVTLMLDADKLLDY